MKNYKNILVVGSSYGSLFAIKAALAGVSVCLIGHSAEIDAINNYGLHINIRGRHSTSTFDLQSSQMTGEIRACAPNDIEPSDFNLIVLAMQEPQYSQPEVKRLMQKISVSGKPCLSIMNMPPPPFLTRFAKLKNLDLSNCYADVSIWDGFNPKLFSHASPDPQAFRPVGSPHNFLQVGLPSNFRAAEFEDSFEASQFHAFASSFNNARYMQNNHMSSVSVKLKISNSPYAPLSKWSMLLAGNYRCLQQNEPQSIKSAVHNDLQKTKQIYDWVNKLIVQLGADASDTIPFNQYAKASLDLVNPSSAARALKNGVTAIERVDKLVQSVAWKMGRDTTIIDPIVALVDSKIRANMLAART